MKKILLAILVLGSFSASASLQSFTEACEIENGRIQMENNGKVAQCELPKKGVRGDVLIPILFACSTNLKKVDLVESTTSGYSIGWTFIECKLH